MTNVAIGAAVLLAFIVTGLAIWLIPRWQVRGWRRAGITGEEKLAELGVHARSSITQAFGGLALIATLAITAYQVNETRRSSDNTLRLAERGQVSDRFSRAVEQLGETDEGPAIDVRTGALFSLRQIGLDSKPYVRPAFLIVARYVRNNYRPPDDLRGDGCDHFRLPRADVAAALTSVLPEVAEKLLEDTGEQHLRGLRGTELDGLALDGLVLKRLNLTGIKFRVARLVRANFRESILSSARFDRACLRGADFRGAILQGANLQDADFSGTRLDGADLRRARNMATTDFTDAEVRDAKFTRGALERTSLSKAQRDVVIVCTAERGSTSSCSRSR